MHLEICISPDQVKSFFKIYLFNVSGLCVVLSILLMIFYNYLYETTKWNNIINSILSSLMVSIIFFHINIAIPYNKRKNNYSKFILELYYSLKIDLVDILASIDSCIKQDDISKIAHSYKYSRKHINESKLSEIIGKLSEVKIKEISLHLSYFSKDILTYSYNDFVISDQTLFKLVKYFIKSIDQLEIYFKQYGFGNDIDQKGLVNSLYEFLCGASISQGPYPQNELVNRINKYVF